MLAIIEVQPAKIRELILRHIVEAWLPGQRKACGTRRPAKESEGYQ